MTNPMTDKHTHDKDGACDTLDGCTLGPYEQHGIIEDCGCTHSPCPCEEVECPYYGALCNLCPVHAAAPKMLEALGWLAVWPRESERSDGKLTANAVEGLANVRRFARDAIKAAKEAQNNG